MKNTKKNLSSYSTTTIIAIIYTISSTNPIYSNLILLLSSYTKSDSPQSSQKPYAVQESQATRNFQGLSAKIITTIHY